jgi:uncharacterized membrane protein YdbT with pleckstrin-like domain
MGSYQDSLMSTGETVQLATHQHWIRLLWAVVLNGLAILVSAAIASWVLANTWSPVDTTGTLFRLRPVLAIVLGIVVLWALANLILAFSRWRAKQYIVTTRRVIEIDGIFNKTVIDSNLDKVNDVVLRQSALGRVLNYGDIEIITGSDIGLNKLDFLHDPLAFKRMMLDNKEDFDSLSRVGADPNGDIPRAEIPAAIEKLGALRDQGLITAGEFEKKKAELLGRY